MSEDADAARRGFAWGGRARGDGTHELGSEGSQGEPRSVQPTGRRLSLDSARDNETLLGFRARRLINSVAEEAAPGSSRHSTPAPTASSPPVFPLSAGGRH